MPLAKAGAGVVDTCAKAALTEYRDAPKTNSKTALLELIQQSWEIVAVHIRLEPRTSGHAPVKGNLAVPIQIQPTLYQRTFGNLAHHLVSYIRTFARFLYGT